MRFLFTIILTLTLGISLAQKYYPSGQLPLYNIDPSEYEDQSPSNHSLVMGSDGMMFIANSGGILYHDGIRIKLVKGLDRKMLNLTINNDGVIYAGGDNEIGLVTHDSLGELVYKTLVDVLPEGLKKFGRVFACYNIENRIAFICEKKIFLFNDLILENIIEIEEFHNSFKFKNKFYIVVKKKGLFELTLTGIKEVSSNKLWQSYNRFFSDENWVYGIGNEDLLKFSIEGNKITNETVRPLHPKLIKQGIHKIIPISTYFFIATEEYGILIFNQDWELVKSINSSNHGLISNYVRGLYLDDGNNLWAALDKGIAVIDIFSNYTIYTKNAGINGVINDISVVNNEIFAVGSQGIISLDLESEELFNDYQLVKGECWSLEYLNFSNKKKLSLATDNTIEFLENGKLTKVVDAIPYDIHQSRNNGNRVWIGEDQGFLTLKWNGKSLVEEFRNQMEAQILNVVSDGKDNVFLGTTNGGVYKLVESELNSLSVLNPQYFDTANGLPANSRFVLPFLIYGEVLFATNKGLYEYNLTNNQFKLSEKFSDDIKFNERYIFRMQELRDNKVWFTTSILHQDKFQSGIYDLNTQSWNYKPFIGLNNGIQYTNYFDTLNDEVFVGGSNGIFRIKSLDERKFKSYDALIVEVKYDPDSVLFGGEYFEGFSNNIYNYSRKPLRFSFGANSYHRKGNLKFKYLLEGFDETWSEWVDESEAVYTNIPGGNYTMRVKAIDYFENESQEASFSFRVLPPWYLTGLAYALYFFGFMGFVYAAVRVSTVSLQRVIKENTREIVAQKDEIERKSDVLEEQKGKIEKQNLNILDSIRYAKRIQLATLPSGNKIKNFLDSSWVMYKPKDIVSGDFYWLERFTHEESERILFSAVDCTGHGVPGAFMSIIGFNGLNRVVREYKLFRPSEILDRLNEIITTTLNQQGASGEEIKDGMDMSICSFDQKNKILEYAGANNSLYIVRKEGSDLMVNGAKCEVNLNEEGYNLFEIKADKQPIGAFENRKNFTNHKIDVQEGDMIYLFTDGYADQFGGPKGKKFFYKPFKRLLINAASRDEKKQQELVEKTFKEWIAHPDHNGEPIEQIDDICVIGVRV